MEFGAALKGVIKEIVYVVEADESEGKLRRCCNVGGIIAYRNKEVLQRILNVMSQGN